MNDVNKPHPAAFSAAVPGDTPFSAAVPRGPNDPRDPDLAPPPAPPPSGRGSRTPVHLAQPLPAPALRRLPSLPARRLHVRPPPASMRRRRGGVLASMRPEGGGGGGRGAPVAARRRLLQPRLRLRLRPRPRPRLRLRLRLRPRLPSSLPVLGRHGRAERDSAKDCLYSSEQK